jgi:hypothetical protein
LIHLGALPQVPLTITLSLAMIINLLGWAGFLGVVCMFPLTMATRYSVSSPSAAASTPAAS